jgi:hypothetical protein
MSRLQATVDSLSGVPYQLIPYSKLQASSLEASSSRFKFVQMPADGISYGTSVGLHTDVDVQ